VSLFRETVKRVGEKQRGRLRSLAFVLGVRFSALAMTTRKRENLLRGDRTPAYVSRETGAAELQISPATWDNWVKDGTLPAACDTFPAGTPRWRWEDVDRKLSGQNPAGDAGAAMRGALNFGKKQGHRRDAA
jgi:hypothetical protein